MRWRRFPPVDEAVQEERRLKRLGPNAALENVEIWWPSTNIRQNFSSVGKNQFIEIREMEPVITKLNRSSFRFGGRASTSPQVERSQHALPLHSQANRP